MELTQSFKDKLDHMKEARTAIAQLEEDEKYIEQEREYVRSQMEQLYKDGLSVEEISLKSSEYEKAYAKGKQTWMQGIADGKDEQQLDEELASITPRFKLFKKLWEIDLRN